MEPTKDSTIKSTTEFWGLLRPDGKILMSGYSGSPMYSISDVYAEFDSNLFEWGYEPILLKKVVNSTTTYYYN